MYAPADAFAALLARHPELEPRGNYAVLRSTEDLARAIAFEPIAEDSKLYVLTAFVQPRFVPADGPSVDYGWHIGGTKRTWTLEDPKLDRALTQATRKLSRIQTTRQFIRRFGSGRRDLYLLEALAFAYANRGKVKKARKWVIRCEYKAQRSKSDEAREVLGRMGRLDRVLEISDSAVRQHIRKISLRNDRSLSEIVT